MYFFIFFLHLLICLCIQYHQTRSLILYFYDMITSSKFFNKSFFTVEYSDDKVQANQVSPWGLVPNRATLDDRILANPSPKKREPSDMRGYQISKNSSQKYVQRKLKAKSHLHKSRDLQPVFDKSKFYTIEQRLNSIQARINKQPQSPHLHQKIKATQSMELMRRIGYRNKRKQQLFPELTINQYNDIKAKGNSMLNNSNPIQEILERRKNRKKILEEFGKVVGSKSRNKSKIQLGKKDREVECQSLEAGKSKVLSGRYVCIAKNPQFSVNGLPTTKLTDQY